MPLDEVRGAIGQIDDDIIDCIVQRMKLADVVFEIKKKENLAIEDKGRNKIVLDRVAKKADEHGLDPGRIMDIFEILIKMSIERQKQLKQGTTG